VTPILPLRRLLLLACLLAALACLAGGWLAAGYWPAACAILPPLIGLGFAARRPAGPLASACLAALVCLAAGGVLMRAPALQMIAGATAALAAWSLANLDLALTGVPPSPSAARLERVHLLTLALALGLGLLLAAAGTLLPLRLPVALLIALALLDLFGLDRLFRTLRDPRPRG
jgi:hypothetical protein